MDSREDAIRTRAYELWEQAGRTGAPEDHWLQAERELSGEAAESATVENTPPAVAVEAAEAATGEADAAERERGEKLSPATRTSSAER